jgi:hypothetical protein
MPAVDRRTDEAEQRWALLIHQIPPRPAYLRVKIGRHLQRVGAVAIKNSVYALPRNEDTLEDLQWILREVSNGGGDGSVVEARFVDGLTDAHVTALFHEAREADYREVARQARAALRDLPKGGPPESRRAEASGQAGRLRRRLAEIAAIDFFGAPGREIAEGLVSGLEERMKPTTTEDTKRKAEPAARPEEVRNRTWVTRAGIKVDRMASAWLVRRFIDPAARFKFVAAKGYAPQKGELRFDMFDAEYTHEGDLCTFEVLVQRFGLADPALRAVAEIVHDIDLKDGKFRREEAAGIAQLVAGIVAAHPGDEARLERGLALFDDLHAACGGPPKVTPP